MQATWLGYLNTTGLSAVDYRLTDDVLDPSGQPIRDTEELIRLPCGMCCFQPPEDARDITKLPALDRGSLTFGSMHNVFKINTGVFDLWAQVLNAVPKARLLMFRDNLTPTAQQHIRHQFAERGIVGERLDLRRGSSSRGYLKVCAEIDVNLDVFPWSGGVTTCESLWMGVPVLTLCGRSASKSEFRGDFGPRRTERLGDPNGRGVCGAGRPATGPIGSVSANPRRLTESNADDVVRRPHFHPRA